jgi:hypothetical protein
LGIPDLSQIGEIGAIFSAPGEGHFPARIFRARFKDSLSAAIVWISTNSIALNEQTQNSLGAREKMRDGKCPSPGPQKMRADLSDLGEVKTR